MSPDQHSVAQALLPPHSLSYSGEGDADIWYSTHQLHEIDPSL